VKLPEPSIAFAIEAKSRNDEDRMGNAVHASSKRTSRCASTRPANSRVPAGRRRPAARRDRGQPAQEALQRGCHPQGAQDSISRDHSRHADVQGRHKKQTGGHGQFGDCWIKMDPLPRGAKFEFANEIFGGSIPRNFIPAVEKGIVDAAEKGFLAGYPMVDFKVTVYDGSYHDVDSSELAFKLAAARPLRPPCRKQALTAGTDHERGNPGAGGIRR